VITVITRVFLLFGLYGPDYLQCPFTATAPIGHGLTVTSRKCIMHTVWF